MDRKATLRILPAQHWWVSVGFVASLLFAGAGARGYGPRFFGAGRSIMGFSQNGCERLSRPGVIFSTSGKPALRFSVSRA